MTTPKITSQERAYVERVIGHLGAAIAVVDNAELTPSPAVAEHLAAVTDAKVGLQDLIDGVEFIDAP